MGTPNGKDLETMNKQVKQAWAAALSTPIIYEWEAQWTSHHSALYLGELECKK